MLKVLIDTSIIIDYLRQKDKSQTILFHLASHKYQLYASIITNTESYAGKSVWERRDAQITLETLFSNIRILTLGDNLSKKAGEISVLNNTNIIDAIIAATAIDHNLKLATLNVIDFEKIQGINLLKIKPSAC